MYYDKVFIYLYLYLFNVTLFTQYLQDHRVVQTREESSQLYNQNIKSWSIELMNQHCRMVNENGKKQRISRTKDDMERSPRLPIEAPNFPNCIGLLVCICIFMIMYGIYMHVIAFVHFSFVYTPSIIHQLMNLYRST